MKWTISVFTSDGKRLIFAGRPNSRREAEALAAEAKRHNPALKIFLTSPTGEVSERGGAR
jgi:hypothetical protein